MLTQLAYRHYGEAVKDVMPALGCHEPLTEEQRERMFGIVPPELFRVHDWRNDVVTVRGTVCEHGNNVLKKVFIVSRGVWRGVMRGASSFILVGHDPSVMAGYQPINIAVCHSSILPPARPYRTLELRIAFAMSIVKSRLDTFPRKW